MTIGHTLSILGSLLVRTTEHVVTCLGSCAESLGCAPRKRQLLKEEAEFPMTATRAGSRGVCGRLAVAQVVRESFTGEVGIGYGPTGQGGAQRRWGELVFTTKVGTRVPSHLILVSTP